MNKRLNIILIIVNLLIALVIVYMTSVINHNEQARIYFKIDDIKNITWKGENASFKTDGNKATLKINDEIIIDNKSIKLDVYNGEISYYENGSFVKGKLYLRSVSENNLIIWYQSQDYRLTKEIIYK